MYICRVNLAQLYKIYTDYPSVQTDTRKIQEGDLYLALRGETFDGNHFAEEALRKGAAYAVIDNEKYLTSDRCILVENVLQTLQDLARYHRQQLEIPCIAITGSNGKTTTKELIMAVLSTVFRVSGTTGNLNNHIGVPLTILRIKKDSEIAVIEMGANHQKEIESYCTIALPTHGLITNCGKAHLEGFGGMEGVRRGKGELFDFIRHTDGIIFRNTDLDYLEEIAAGIKHQVTYGAHNADYTGIPVSHAEFLNAAITTPMNECLIRTQMVGSYNIANILAAFAVGRTFNIPVETIRKALEEYSPDNSRSQLIRQESNTIILDAYNANPTSMQAAISNFALADYPNKVVMIGAMKELGERSLDEHQHIVSLLEQTNWNDVVLVGGDFANVKHHYLFMETSVEAGKWMKQKVYKHTAFLIKGSRAFEMEKVLSE